MEAQEVKDFEVLMNIFFPFAEELLRKFGEFHPFAGAISNEGDVISVGEHQSDTPMESQQLVTHLKDTLKTDKDKIKAGTVFYDVRTTDHHTGSTSDAIAVFVEHKEGASAYEFFYPYELHGKEEITMHESFGNALKKEIF
jgi:hypothetical protein